MPLLTRNGRAMRVLIVEDETLIALDLAVTIEEAGGTVVGQCRTAHEAFELACKIRPDVLITDVRLPGGADGIEVATKVRREFPDCCIVILTGFFEAGAQERIRAAKAAVVRKPAEPSELIAAIRRTCGLEPSARACDRA